MIIVKIIGGLGNQMFQYAYAKVLFKHGYKVKLDISSFDTYSLHEYGLKKYDIGIEIISKYGVDYIKGVFLNKVFQKIGFKNKIVNEKNLLFTKNLINPNEDSYINGYFQSEKYFKDIRAYILEDFTIMRALSKYTQKIEKDIQNTTNPISLHIRRGDYVNDDITNSIHGTCDLNYYEKAIKYLNNSFENNRYFIFSDDISWVKENLKLDNAIYIDSKESRIPHEDIYLMSLCNHNIIANSSFSWWGAWLNCNDGKIVIAPRRWFASDELNNQSKDIVCDSWIRL